MEEFRFKKFSVSHSRSSMKVGVDGVLIGAWTKLNEKERILDLGTGCGLIALMCAQRSAQSQILGIDIDMDSVAEAKENFSGSPWADRLRAECVDFLDLYTEEPFSVIVSNPPYFDSGVRKGDSSRILARHQITLPLDMIIRHSMTHLTDNGRLNMIFPASGINKIESAVSYLDCALTRKTYVRGHDKASYKRVMAEFTKGISLIHPEETYLTLNDSDGNPTPEHRELCGDFYLYF